MEKWQIGGRGMVGEEGYLACGKFEVSGHLWEVKAFWELSFSITEQLMKGRKKALFEAFFNPFHEGEFYKNLG